MVDEWDALLDRSTDEIVTAMIARTQDGIDLRQLTPFCRGAHRRGTPQVAPVGPALFDGGETKMYLMVGACMLVGVAAMSLDNRATSLARASPGQHGAPALRGRASPLEYVDTERSKS